MSHTTSSAHDLRSGRDGWLLFKLFSQLVFLVCGAINQLQPLGVQLRGSERTTIIEAMFEDFFE